MGFFCCDVVVMKLTYCITNERWTYTSDSSWSLKISASFNSHYRSASLSIRGSRWGAWPPSFSGWGCQHVDDSPWLPARRQNDRGPSGAALQHGWGWGRAGRPLHFTLRDTVDIWGRNSCLKMFVFTCFGGFWGCNSELISIFLWGKFYIPSQVTHMLNP